MIPKDISPANQLLNQLIETHGVKDTIKALSKLSGYEETPPTIREFIDNEEYMGTILGEGLYPMWRKALYEIYPNPFYSPFMEIVLTGSIGQGKTTCALAGMFYDMCKLMLLRDPHGTYGLLATKKIVFAFINATLGLSKDVVWDMAETWINESPFFKSRQQKKNRNNINTLFPKKIDITYGSRTSHVLGMDTVSAILSEINDQTRITNQAYNNYNAIRTRLQSRFMSKGSYPGRIWIDSSKKDSGSFIDSVILRGREDDPTLKVHDHPIWEALAHKGLYSGETFKVFIGDQHRDPFIITNTDQVIGIPEDRIIDVPVEFKSEFHSDIHGNLRDLAGIATQAAYRFITSIERIEQGLTKKKNPVRKEELYTDFFDKEEKLIDFIDFEKIKPDGRGRFIHIDLGIVGDRCGIASSRIDGHISVKRMNYQLGNTYEEKEVTYCTDFVLYIIPKSGQEVPIYKIRQLINDLSIRGYPIALISTDGYQSTNLRQDLIMDGFQSELRSVDRTSDPYNELKNAILEGRWDGVDHPLLRKEIKELERAGGKIDHPRKGSKDGSDAVAGSLWSAKIHIDDYGAAFTPDEVIGELSKMNKRTRKELFWR